MLIESIRIRNFRQFRGEQKIDFSTNKEKNVTVIMGENGAGKTTLEQAFTWCLYGSNSFRVAELINREIRDSLGYHDRVQVLVELIISQNDREYKVTRKQDVERETQKANVKAETFTVAERDKNGDWSYLKDIVADAKVREMLPKELASFFFFDGERIDFMSKELLEKGKSTNFEGAVRGLVGLNAMKAAMDHFGPATRKTTVSGKFNAEIDEHGSERLADYTKTIELADQQIEAGKKRIDEILPEIDRYLNNVGSYNKELKDMQNDVERRQKYEKMEREIQAHELEKVKATKSMFAFFSKNAGAMFSKPLLKRAMLEIKAADKLDKGIPYIHADTITFLLKRSKCICGADLTTDEDKKKHLQDLIQALPPNSLGNMIGQFSAEVRARGRMAENFEEYFDGIVQNIRKLDSEIVSKQNLMAEIVNHLADKNRVKTIQERIRVAESRVKQYRHEHNILVGNIRQFEMNQKNAENKRKELIANDQRNRVNIQYLNYAQAVYDKLAEAYQSKEIEVREELEKTINQIFEDIYDGGIHIHVTERYNIITTVTDTDEMASGDELEKNTAQSYAIIFAFIAGIIEMAKKDDGFGKEERIEKSLEGYPLVMDAPLSSFDKTRIHRICDALPKIAEQVIIFIKDTDGELAEHHLANRIGGKWLLRAERKTSSLIERRG